MKNALLTMVLAVVTLTVFNSCKEEAKEKTDFTPEEMATASASLNDCQLPQRFRRPKRP